MPEPPPELAVQITKELRDAAEALANSVLSVDHVKIENAIVLGVLTTFETAVEAGNATAQLVALRTAVVGNGVLSVPEQPVDAPGVVSVPLELFLPTVFTKTTDRILATKLDSFETPETHFTLAELFLAAYDHPTIVLHRFHFLPDYSDTVWYAETEAGVLRAHEMMIQFLRVLVTQKPKGPSHRVVIKARFAIVVDGVEPKLSPAQKRCVLALACLRKREPFTVVEFTKFYTGKDGVKVGVGKKDFNNAISVTKKVMPHLHHEAKSGNRFVSGIIWRITPTDQELADNLKLLHPLHT